MFRRDEKLSSLISRSYCLLLIPSFYFCLMILCCLAKFEAEPSHLYGTRRSFRVRLFLCAVGFFTFRTVLFTSSNSSLRSSTFESFLYVYDPNYHSPFRFLQPTTKPEAPPVRAPITRLGQGGWSRRMNREGCVPQRRDFDVRLPATSKVPERRTR